MSATFAELPLRSETIEALHAHGFLAPFAIQEMVLPIALADGDVIGQAKTGTGKTLAFGIPVIERVIAPRRILAGKHHTSKFITKRSLLFAMNFELNV